MQKKKRAARSKGRYKTQFNLIQFIPEGCRFYTTATLNRFQTLYFNVHQPLQLWIAWRYPLKQ